MRKSTGRVTLEPGLLDSYESICSTSALLSISRTTQLAQKYDWKPGRNNHKITRPVLLRIRISLLGNNQGTMDGMDWWMMGGGGSDELVMNQGRIWILFFSFAFSFSLFMIPTFGRNPPVFYHS